MTPTPVTDIGNTMMKLAAALAATLALAACGVKAPLEGPPTAAAPAAVAVAP